MRVKKYIYVGCGWAKNWFPFFFFKVLVTMQVGKVVGYVLTSMPISHALFALDNCPGSSLFLAAQNCNRHGNPFSCPGRKGTGKPFKFSLNPLPPIVGW